MRDLRDRNDLEALLRAFYGRAMADPLIGPVFTEVARMDLEHHLPVITDFWDTVLFGAGTYGRNLLALHAALDGRSPLTEARFARWLALWKEAVDERFAGPVAERAKSEAGRAAATIRRQLDGGSGSALTTIRTREADGPEGVRR